MFRVVQGYGIHRDIMALNFLEKYNVYSEVE